MSLKNSKQMTPILNQSSLALSAEQYLIFQLFLASCTKAFNSLSSDYIAKALYHYISVRTLYKLK